MSKLHTKTLKIKEYSTLINTLRTYQVDPRVGQRVNRSKKKCVSDGTSGAS